MFSAHSTLEMGCRFVVLTLTIPLPYSPDKQVFKTGANLLTLSWWPARTSGSLFPKLFQNSLLLVHLLFTWFALLLETTYSRILFLVFLDHSLHIVVPSC